MLFALKKIVRIIRRHSNCPFITILTTEQNEFLFLKRELVFKIWIKEVAIRSKESLCYPHLFCLTHKLSFLKINRQAGRF